MGKGRDYTGARRGLLTAVEPVDGRLPSYPNSILWKFQCDCGKVIYHQASHVFAKNSRKESCGCKIRRWTPYSVGDQLKGWTIRDVDLDRRRYICECACGTVKSFAHGTIQQGRYSDKCRNCFSFHRIKDATRSAIIRSLRSSAKANSRDFLLSDDETIDMIFSNCYYCNTPPSNLRKGSHGNEGLYYSGLDRLDTYRDYTLHNVVPCCIRCNFSKNQRGHAEFLQWIFEVYHHSVLGDSFFTANDFMVNDRVVRYVHSRLKYRNKSHHWPSSGLSNERLKSVISLNCTYCNRPPENSFQKIGTEYKFTGVDRINSSRGYEDNNIQPACKRCNSSKNIMSHSSFISFISEVYNNFWEVN